MRGFANVTGSFFQVNPLRRGVVLFLALRSLSFPSLTLSAISSHALSLLSSSHLFACAVVIAVATSSREYFLSACHLCISSHLLTFLCEMSSCGEMGEAIELRWVRNRAGNCVLCVCVLLRWCLCKPVYICFCIFESMHINQFCISLDDHAPGCIQLSNWVICRRCSQHLGLFFTLPVCFFASSWPFFNGAEICRLDRGQCEIWASRDTGSFGFLLFCCCWLLATVVCLATAKLIIGPAQAASTGLIAANSLSRCISPHAHMEEIKPARLFLTPNIFFLHDASACFCVHALKWVSMHTWHAFTLFFFFFTLYLCFQSSSS